MATLFGVQTIYAIAVILLIACLVVWLVRSIR